MFLVALLIFQAHMCKVFADKATTKTANCNTYNEDVDGYNLLAVNSTFRLVETTFRAGYFNTYRCITATTIEKNGNTHEVTEQIEYQVVAGNRWDYYIQTFIFELDIETQKYNKMNSLEPSGAPNGKYEFLYTDPSCTVIKALSFDLPPNDTIIPQERGDDNADNLQAPYHCMLWVKDDKENAPDECCRNRFRTLCRDKQVRQAFSTTECQKRSAGSNPEEDTKTGGN
uniref:Putative lipocalin-6 1 n=1 Tax=Amblyomma americanum TaxID=6943 RepID=A0A0C9S5D9_AMBAM